MSSSEYPGLKTLLARRLQRAPRLPSSRLLDESVNLFGGHSIVVVESHEFEYDRDNRDYKKRNREANNRNISVRESPFSFESDRCGHDHMNSNIPD